MISKLHSYRTYIEKHIGELANQGAIYGKFPFDKLWLSFDDAHRDKFKDLLGGNSYSKILRNFEDELRREYYLYGLTSHLKTLYYHKYDPFEALKNQKGQEISGVITGMVKKVYLDALRKHTLNPNDNRETFADAAANSKIQDICDAYPDLRSILIPEFSIRTMSSLLIPHFSEEELKQYSALKKTKISNGKIVASDPKAQDISARATASFAAGITAAETGQQAQAKMSTARKDKMTVNPRGGKPHDPKV